LIVTPFSEDTKMIEWIFILITGLIFGYIIAKLGALWGAVTTLLILAGYIYALYDFKEKRLFFSI
jgi:membrane protease YdiL (CAAX protease family)